MIAHMPSRETYIHTVNTAILGSTALVSKLHPESPDIIPQVAYDSMAHPLLGYIGAYAASKLVSYRQTFCTAFYMAGATTVNFLTEISQDAILKPEHPFYSPSQMPETIKDYSFTLGGAAIFAGIDRVIRRRKESQELTTMQSALDR